VTGPRVPVAGSTVRGLLAGAMLALGPGSGAEARWLVAHALGRRAGDLMVGPDDAVDAAVVTAVDLMVDRRLAGTPLQYVLGTWEFRTLEVEVDPRVLIPRPETEQVVEVALRELAVQAGRVTPGRPLVAVDLGAGSGVVALSLAAEGAASSRALEVWATDASPGALDVLASNLAALAKGRPEAAGRVVVAEGAWFDALPRRLAGEVGLVVSNPPYVSAPEFEALDPGVRDHEPVAALVPGPTGFEAIEAIVTEARHWLVPGGSLVVEHAPAQAEAAVSLALALGYRDATTRDDLAGRPRMVVARWPGEGAPT